MGQGLRIASEQSLDVGLAPAKQGGVADRAVLDHLGQARLELALRQGRQRVHVGDHRARLVEGTDHVLAQRVVDRGLATDRRVHLRQQSGRDLHKWHTPHIAGGSKSGHVANHTAAQRVDHCLAVAAFGQQLVVDEFQRRSVLVLLAVWQHNLQQAAVATRELRGQSIGIKRADRRVGDDQRFVGCRQAGPGCGLTQQAAADVDVIAAITQRNGNLGRGDGGVHVGPVYSARSTVKARLNPRAAARVPPSQAPGRGRSRRPVPVASESC